MKISLTRTVNVSLRTSTIGSKISMWVTESWPRVLAFFAPLEAFRLPTAPALVTNKSPYSTVSAVLKVSSSTGALSEYPNMLAGLRVTSPQRMLGPQHLSVAPPPTHTSVHIPACRCIPSNPARAAFLCSTRSRSGHYKETRRAGRRLGRRWGCGVRRWTLWELACSSCASWTSFVSLSARTSL